MGFYVQGPAHEMRLVRIDRRADLAIPAAGSAQVALASISRPLPGLLSTQLCKPFISFETSKSRQLPLHCKEPRRRVRSATSIKSSMGYEMQFVRIG